MSVIVNARVFASAGLLAIVAGCALLLTAPPLVATDITTANIEPAKAPKSLDSVRVGVDQLHQLGIVPVVTDQFRIQKPAIGQIAFNEDASTVVHTPFSGRVTRLIARMGDDVKRGDPLFEIDSPEVVQAQTDLIAALHGLEKSKSQLALAKRVLDRQTSLMADKATAMREVDQARNDYAIAESDLATAQGTVMAARNRLRVIVGRDRGEVERVERERSVNPLITINAPIDGTVIARKVGPGQYVRSDAGDPLYSIADLSVMWLKANVPEADIAHVRVGQEIEVRVTAVPDRVFKARISAIGAASDTATRRVVVRSEIPNPDRALKSDMFASFRITIGGGEPAPVVPIEAVIRDGDQAAVWVVREPMLFHRRKVKLGLERDGRVQVLEGIDPGENVVGRGAVFIDNESRS
ncbi:MAG: rane fusion protein heavy metal efflux system [Hyphomicrobiales bacterium]|jgi:cobalt-zinc-cadmium efflux system membrane fusion protein|nr:rane fusion protein heavy metal efflux system [Hyphomicrobiales bacterium]